MPAVLRCGITVDEPSLLRRPGAVLGDSHLSKPTVRAPAVAPTWRFLRSSHLV